MESVILEIAPSALDWLAEFVPALGQFSVIGVLLAFLSWLVSYTIAYVFNWIQGRTEFKE